MKVKFCRYDLTNGKLKSVVTSSDGRVTESEGLGVAVVLKEHPAFDRVDTFGWYFNFQAGQLMEKKALQIEFDKDVILADCIDICSVVLPKYEPNGTIAPVFVSVDGQRMKVEDGEFIFSTCVEGDHDLKFEMVNCLPFILTVNANGGGF